MKLTLKIYNYIVDEKVEILQKLNKRKQKELKSSVRLKDTTFVMGYVYKINFAPISHDESKIPYLSPFGTFCDRYKFYYEPGILSLNDKLQRVTRNMRDVKEHKEVVSAAKKLLEGEQND